MSGDGMDLRRIASRIARDEDEREFDQEDDSEHRAWWQMYLEELHEDVKLLETFIQGARGELYEGDSKNRRATLIALAMLMRNEIPNHSGTHGLTGAHDAISRQVKGSPYYRVGDDADLNQAAVDEMKRLDSLLKPLLKRSRW